MKIKIPESLKLEHKELHSQLAEATKIGAKIAEAAVTYPTALLIVRD